MNSFEEGIDPVLRAEFIDESLDGMEQVAGLFVQLESEPENMDCIQAIFRPVHSIKGNAVYFGLMQTKTLAHEMETILDLMRKGALSPTRSVMDVLLQGSDTLIAMLGRAREGDSETSDLQALEQLVEQVKSLALSGAEDEETLWRKLLEGVGQGDLTQAMPLLRQLAESRPAGRKALGTQSAQEPATPAELPEPARELESLFSDANASPNSDEVMDLLQACRACIETPENKKLADTAIADIRALADSIGLDDMISHEAVKGFLQEMTDAAAWKSAPADFAPSDDAPPPPDQTTTPQPPAPAKQATKPGAKTMRIPEGSIDEFLSYVGELVTLGEMYGHLHANIKSNGDARSAASELGRINDSFRDLSLSLQDSVMMLRKVPMQNILSRVTRIIRDIANANGKEIAVQVKGSELLADKSIVDSLEAPLTHMVRNAADHGIEPAEQRKQAGKDPGGNIDVEARETTDDIVLTVRDDGRGLDRDALAAKAVELGLIPSTQDLTEDDIVELLFQSGVSTAEKVSDVSGRGVGMDAVKRAIDEMGGRIRVQSEPGKGSVFTITLPKTVSTQIIDGFIVVVGGNRYVLPLERVVRCFRPESESVTSIQNREVCVRDGEELLTVTLLTNSFGKSHNGSGAELLQDGILVVVESGKQHTAIHVDAIEGVRQVVVKELNELVETRGIFTGCAVMGDGTVAMILDLDSVTPQQS